MGNFDAAHDQFTRSVAAFRAVGAPWGVGNGLTGLAAAALATGDTGRAERLIEEAMASLGSSGPSFLSLTLDVRAILAVRRGDALGAIVVVRESLAHTRDLQDTFAFLYALVPLAAAAVLRGDDEWAAQILGTRASVTERTGVTVVDRAAHDFGDRPNVTCVPASAQIDGHERMPRGGGRRSTRCSRPSMRSSQPVSSPRPGLAPAARLNRRGAVD